MKMFLQILNSLPKQMFSPSEVPTDYKSMLSNLFEYTFIGCNFSEYIGKLKTLGFTGEDCQQALEKCNYKLDDAALWLTQNALTSTNNDVNNDSFLNISNIEVTFIT